jgi:LacI family sucrose operon transcriptional repressor
MPTIKDVAKYAKVSVATVSRIMNNRGAISEKTRKKVYKAMKDLDYHPNEMARALQNKKSHIIGLIVPHIDYSFFSRLTEAIEETCYERGYKLLLCKSGELDGRERELVSMLQSNKVDGILVCSRVGDASAYANYALPVVSIDREIPGVPSVTSDNYKGGILAAQTLLEAGCRHLLLYGYILPDYMPANLRYQGFRDECKRRNVEWKEVFTKDNDYELIKILPKELEETITSHSDIDGIFLCSDDIAARVVVGCQGLGLKVPDNFRMVGFDGLSISEFFDLTTIEQPIRQMGEYSVDLLIKKIEGKMVPERSILPVQVIVRGSTAANIK